MRLINNLILILFMLVFVSAMNAQNMTPKKVRWKSVLLLEDQLEVEQLEPVAEFGICIKIENRRIESINDLTSKELKKLKKLASRNHCPIVALSSIDKSPNVYLVSVLGFVDPIPPSRGI